MLAKLRLWRMRWTYLLFGLQGWLRTSLDHICPVQGVQFKMYTGYGLVRLWPYTQTCIVIRNTDFVFLSQDLIRTQRGTPLNSTLSALIRRPRERIEQPRPPTPMPKPNL